MRRAKGGIEGLRSSTYQISVVRLANEYRVSCCGRSISVKDVRVRRSNGELRVADRMNATGTFVDISSMTESLASTTLAEYEALFKEADDVASRRTPEEWWHLLECELKLRASGRIDLLVAALAANVKYGEVPSVCWDTRIEVPDSQSVSSAQAMHEIVVAQPSDAKELEAIVRQAADAYRVMLHGRDS